MILSAQKLFDFALIAATKAGPEIRPLVDFLNNNLEKLVRAASGELTLQDNVKGQIIFTPLQHGVATSVACSSTDIHGVSAMQCESDAISALNWQFDSKGALQLTAYFQSFLEYTNLASFPTTGRAGKTYVDLTTGKFYQWSTSYVEATASTKRACKFFVFFK